MKIAIRREPIEGERRVAATPAAVAQYVAAGYAVTVQKGAGIEAGYADAAYAEAGAELAASIPLSAVEVLVHVRPLDTETIIGSVKKTGRGSRSSPTRPAPTDVPSMHSSRQASTAWSPPARATVR